MDTLTDPGKPVDIAFLDSVVRTFYGGSGAQQVQAKQILESFSSSPNAWQKVDQILTKSQSQETKFIALNILNDTIKFHWKVLPREQCLAIRNFIGKIIFDIAGDATRYRTEKVILNKLDETLVQVMKQEWPQNWPNMIPDIVKSSQTSIPVCENNMTILQLLSEEVFDFSAGEMTSEKISLLKGTFNSQFGDIFNMCMSILANDSGQALYATTLKTFLKFLSWIQASYLIRKDVIDLISLKFLPQANYRNMAIQCLTEIVTIDPPSDEFRPLFSTVAKHTLKNVCSALQSFLPLSTDLSLLFAKAELEREQRFVRYLAIFFHSFFRHHLAEVECPESEESCKLANDYMVLLSRVDDDEVFKICIEYWNFLAETLYNQAKSVTPSSSIKVNPVSPLMTDMTSGVSVPTPDSPQMAAFQMRLGFYSPFLSQMRMIMISRFAKPEEVLITEENGQVIREYVKDTETTALYVLMRECLVYLTHLNPVDTEKIMLDKLKELVSSSVCPRAGLNSLAWAVGSISGAMSEEAEKKFIVPVIRDLLMLVDKQRTKDDKAAIAGDIMYVVGQYPRFLKAHWRFLKVVINKLFEFMHEPHPGVKDMAVDTFLKISVKCRRKIATVNAGDTEPYATTIVKETVMIICDLEPQQQNSFYEAMGNIISAQPDPKIRDLMVQGLMSPPNAGWKTLVMQAQNDFAGFCVRGEGLQRMANVLRVNIAAAKTLGSAFTCQLGAIYVDMLDVYKIFSAAVNEQIKAAPNPDVAASLAVVKSMRIVKQEILKLIQTYIDNSQNQDSMAVARNFVSPLLMIVLPDYKSNPPAARDAPVLSLMTSVISRLGSLMTDNIPVVFDNLFQSTLEMITRNFTDFPDHRIYFFNLISAVNANCFAAFFNLNPPSFKLLMDSIFWAIRHTERTVAETGIETLKGFLLQVERNPEIAARFYKSYLVTVLNEIFSVFTDSFHKSEFSVHVGLLRHLFGNVISTPPSQPFWDTTVPGIPPDMTNERWLRDFVCTQFTAAFPHVARETIVKYVDLSLSNVNDMEAFSSHLRDFLVSIKEYSATGNSNSDMYVREKEEAEAKKKKAELERREAVPGLIKPSDMPGEQV